MIDIKGWSVSNGCKIAWGNIEILRDSYDEFYEMSKSGQLYGVQDSVFNKWGSFHKGKELGMKTIILIAVPTSTDAKKIIFDLNGKKVEAFLPPCYSDNSSKNLEYSIERSLSDFIGNFGYKVERFLGPYKNLAGKLGLGKYGRNNLIYVEGFGSYVRLIGFVTNAEFETKSYPEVKANKLTLESCEKCSACRNNCPTGAISGERFRLNVDRCLSDYSESTDEWPGFVKEAKNKCLVGCLNCQQVCPHNKGLTNSFTILQENFTKDETDYILGKTAKNGDDIIKAVEEKMKGLGLDSHKEYIVRNLRSLINNIYL